MGEVTKGLSRASCGLAVGTAISEMGEVIRDFALF